MFAKVFILCATLVAANANVLHGVALASTGNSIESRQQDSLGNYAFGYDIVDQHTSSKSRSEVGDGFGNKAGSYSSQINHVAPVGVAHAAPVAFAAPIAPAPIALAHSAPVAVAHAAPVAYSTSSLVRHVAPGPVVAAPFAHAAPYAVGPAPLAYSALGGHLAAAPIVAGHGLVAPHLGALTYGGLRSIHY